jgi:hypothetical protein
MEAYQSPWDRTQKCSRDILGLEEGGVSGDGVKGEGRGMYTPSGTASTVAATSANTSSCLVDPSKTLSNANDLSPFRPCRSSATETVFPLILTQLLRLASPGLTLTATPKFPPKLISDISSMHRRCRLIIFWQCNGETQRISHRQRLQPPARSSAASPGAQPALNAGIAESCQRQAATAVFFVTDFRYFRSQQSSSRTDGKNRFSNPEILFVQG